MTKPRYCPACGTPNKQGAKFCTSCGKDFPSIKKAPVTTRNPGSAQDNSLQPEPLQTQSAPSEIDSKAKPASPKESATPKDESRTDAKPSASDPFIWSEPKPTRKSDSIVQTSNAISPQQIKLYFGIAAGAIALIALLVFFATGTGKSQDQDSAEPLVIEQNQFEGTPQSIVVAPPLEDGPDQQEQERLHLEAETLAEQEKLAALSRQTQAEEERLRLQQELERVQAENLRIQAEKDAAIAADKARAAKAAQAALAAPQSKQDPAQSAAFKRILEKSQSCYRAQDYDCAINSAEIGLDLVANHKELKFIIAESQKRQTEALNNITIQ